MTQGLSLLREQGIELGCINFGSLELRLGIVVWIIGIDLSNEVLRQSACHFHPVERFER
jgi:hypothetical protein